MFANLLINAYEALERPRRSRRSRRAWSRTGDDGALLPDGHHAGADAWSSTSPTTGPGVPPDIADKIFNPFFTTKPQGSGLGLAIVRKIVDAHEGRIDMTSAAGRGTKLPRHAAG